MIGRREFIRDVTAAGAAGLLGLRAEPVRAEPPPETTRLRMVQIPSICQSPQYIATDLLRSEGFTDVQYVRKEGTEGIERALATGEADINGHFAAPLILRVEAGDPIVILAGETRDASSCSGGDRVRAIHDLKGKTVGVPGLDSSRYVFLASMVAHVGLRLRKDIKVVTLPGSESMRLLAEGKIQGYLGFPPEPQELRAKKIGHLVVSSGVDRPWSQYFCCMLAANREFVRKYPVATKRALCGIVKATNICALEPARVARFLVDKSFTDSHDYALAALTSLPYGRWRDFDAEDTLRFYALRLHERE